MAAAIRAFASETGYEQAPMSAELTEVARYRVVFADCDPMRIMYYGSYFRLFEIGRAELFRHLGHPFTRYIAEGLYLAVVETSCRYHRPARYDDVLTIRAGFGAITRATLEIVYELYNVDGDKVASASTRHAVVDEQGRPQRLPAAVRDLAG